MILICYITTQRTKQTLLTKRERFISLSSTFEFVDLELLVILLDYVRAMDLGRIGGEARGGGHDKYLLSVRLRCWNY